jgi:hypothetical protein
LVAEILMGILSQHGYQKAASEADANVVRGSLTGSHAIHSLVVQDCKLSVLIQVLLNTCAIREKAEQKVLCRLGELKARKKRSTPDRCFSRMHASAHALMLTCVRQACCIKDVPCIFLLTEQVWRADT